MRYKVLLAVLCLFMPFVVFAIKADNDAADSYYNKALDKYNSGDYTNAAVYFDRSLKANPDADDELRMVIYAMMGDCYSKTDDDAKAYDYFVKSINHMPDAVPDELKGMKLGVLLNAGLYGCQLDKLGEALDYLIDLKKFFDSEPESVKVTNMDSYLLCLRLLGMICVEAESYDNAEAILLEAVQAISEYNVAPSDVSLGVRHDLIELYQTKRQYNIAIIHNLTLLDSLKEAYGEDSDEYIQQLYTLANSYYLNKEYNRAIARYEKIVELAKRYFSVSSDYYYTPLHMLCKANMSINNTDEALKWANEAVSIADKYGDADQRIESLRLVALVSYGDGNYDRALDAEHKVLRIVNDKYGTNSCQTVESHSELAKYYAIVLDHANQYIEAKKAFDIASKIYKQGSPNYLTALNIYCEALYSYGKSDESISLIKSALDKIKSHDEQYAIKYCDLSLTLSKAYSSMHNYTEAIGCLDELRAYCTKYLDDKGILFKIASEQGDCYSSMGAYDQALAALDCASALLGDYNDDDYDLFVNLWGKYEMVYMMRGNPSKSQEYSARVQDIKSGNSSQYVIDLNSFVSLAYEVSNYIIIKDYERADAIVDDAINRLSGSSGGQIVLPVFYNIASISKFAQKQYDLAEGYILKVLAHDEANGDTSSATHANNLALLGRAKVYLNDLEQAKMYLDQSEVLYDTAAKRSLRTYNDLLFGKCEYAYATRDFDMLKHCALAVDNSLSKTIRRNFAFLTTEERTNYWNIFKTWYYDDLPLYNYESGGLYNELAYDTALFSKGVLLNAEIQLAKAVEQEGSPEIKRAFDRLIKIRSDRDMAIADTENIDEQRLKQLDKDADDLERKILASLSAFKEYNDAMSVTWTQVRDCLKPGEMAVEFQAFTHPDSLLTVYSALVLTSGCMRPRLVKLCDERALKDLTLESIYDSAAIYDLIWRPILELAGAVKHIYFAPDGDLYRIAVESVPYAQGHGAMADNFGMYRLSSTRQIINNRNGAKRQFSSAVAYGGLHYDTDVSELINDSRQRKSLGDLAMSRGFDPELFADRAGVQFLSGTLAEVEAIEDLAQSHGTKIRTYTGSKGTELSVKTLSGAECDILHIATHGFYYTELEQQMMNLLKAQDPAAQKVDLSNEDIQLSRTGLLFAGANHTLTGGRMPEGIDDGILTANEISRLDFKGVDLVVLSACQSGLGDISADGVMGLQRGLKKAGVSSILMTLWRVDDKATQIFMHEFYRNLFDGGDKYAALQSAQSYLRSYTDYSGSHCYAHPHYWAAFVMLDPR